MTFLMQVQPSKRPNYPIFYKNTGFGSESKEISRKEQSFVRHFILPISRSLTNPYVKFETNKTQWEKETKFYSSVEKIAMHPAYQRVIGMGMDAVPFILQDLHKEPKQWFWALKAITNADPVPIEDRGRVKKMASSWIAWGRDNGFI